MNEVNVERLAENESPTLSSPGALQEPGLSNLEEKAETGADVPCSPAALQGDSGAMYYVVAIEYGVIHYVLVKVEEADLAEYAEYHGCDGFISEDDRECLAGDLALELATRSDALGDALDEQEKVAGTYLSFKSQEIYGPYSSREFAAEEYPHAFGV